MAWVEDVEECDILILRLNRVLNAQETKIYIVFYTGCLSLCITVYNV